MRKTIIVVEDDNEVLEMLASFFAGQYNVHTATNGEIALDLFFQVKPEIVVTDIIMPKMDGLDLTKKIKHISPETLIFVVSGAKKINLRNAAEAGANRVYEKPGGIISLMEEVSCFFTKPGSL